MRVSLCARHLIAVAAVVSAAGLPTGPTTVWAQSEPAIVSIASDDLVDAVFAAPNRYRHGFAHTVPVNYQGQPLPELPEIGPNPLAGPDALPVESPLVPPIVRGPNTLGQQNPIFTPEYAAADRFAGQPGFSNNFAPPIGPAAAPNLSPTFSGGVTPFYSHITYGDDSIKSTGDVGGVYSFLYNGRETFEFNYDYTDIRFDSGFQYEQDGFTFVYTNWMDEWRTRHGVKIVEANDQLSSMYSLFGGIYRYEPLEWEAGADFYYSHYRDRAPELDVFQLNPRFGRTIADDDGRSFNWQMTGYWIAFNQSINGEQHLFSGEARATWVTPYYDFGVFGWVGEQSFAMRKDGFIVFNLDEKHTSGYAFELNLKPTSYVNVTPRIAVEKFSDFANNADTHQVFYSIFVSYLF